MGLFRTESLQHKKAKVYGQTMLYQPLSFSILTLIASLLIVAIIALLLFASFNQKETAVGFVKPTTGIKKIMALAPGLVNQLKVKEGSIVKKGQVLLTLENKNMLSEDDSAGDLLLQQIKQAIAENEKQIQHTRSKNALLLVQINDEIDGFKTDIKHLQNQRKTLLSRWQLVEEQLSTNKNLLKNGTISQSEYNQSYDKYLAMRQDLEINEQSLSKLNTNIRSASTRLKQVPIDSEEKIAQINSAIQQLQSQRVELSLQLGNSVVAPIAGRVTAIQISRGQQVLANTLLMNILPLDGKFEAVLLVSTEAIGFLTTDQEVKIRYAAFPHERYGSYTGRIASISKTILLPNEYDAPIKPQGPAYRVNIRLDQQFISAYGKQLPLQSGMLLNGDVIIERLSIIDWLLQPLYRLKGS